MYYGHNAYVHHTTDKKTNFWTIHFMAKGVETKFKVAILTRKWFA